MWSNSACRNRWMDHGNCKKTVFSDFEVLAALHMLPDGASLTTDEAAIFLRKSRSSMERMRRGGEGPDYVQGGEKGAKGVNQKCVYIKSSIMDWQKSNTVNNSMAAASRRGQAYIPYVNPTPRRSPFDLITKRAFYIDAKRKLAGCVDETPIQTVIERLGGWDYVWLSPIHAAQKEWSSSPEYQEFAQGVKQALMVAIQGIDGSLLEDVDSGKANAWSRTLND